MENVKRKIQSLITKANDTTGKGDGDLTNAVLSVADGYGAQPAGKLVITENDTDIDVKEYASVDVVVPETPDSPLPIEVATETEMNALLETAEVGSVYKFTGTRETYETDALYVVELSE